MVDRIYIMSNLSKISKISKFIRKNFIELSGILIGLVGLGIVVPPTIISVFR